MRIAPLGDSRGYICDIQHRCCQGIKQRAKTIEVIESQIRDNEANDDRQGQ